MPFASLLIFWNVCCMHQDTVARLHRIELNWIQHEYAISIRLKVCTYSAFKCTIFLCFFYSLSLSFFLNANQLKSDAENDKNLCRFVHVHHFEFFNSSFVFYLCFAAFPCPFMFYLRCNISSDKSQLLLTLLLLQKHKVTI